MPKGDGFGGTCFRHDGREDLDYDQVLGHDDRFQCPEPSPRRPIQSGDFLTYATYGGAHRSVIVTRHYDDMKYGEPGFTGEMANGAKVWGYDRQVVLWPGE
jgi:hypothetical protein